MQWAGSPEHPDAVGGRRGVRPASLLPHPPPQPQAHQLRQQCLAQYLLLLGCEAGGELDVKEDEKVPFLGWVLWQWHPLTWHLLEVLGTEMGG